MPRKHVPKFFRQLSRSGRLSQQRMWRRNKKKTPRIQTNAVCSVLSTYWAVPSEGLTIGLTYALPGFLTQQRASWPTVHDERVQRVIYTIMWRWKLAAALPLLANDCCFVHCLGSPYRGAPWETTHPSRFQHSPTSAPLLSWHLP